MNKYIHAIDDNNFEAEVLQSSVPVVVDFWAEWCGPCKALAPIFEQAAEHFAGKVKFVKLDVDSNVATPSKFSVRGIPTLIVFKDGQVQGTKVGLVNQSELINFIDQYNS